MPLRNKLIPFLFWMSHWFTGLVHTCIKHAIIMYVSIYLHTVKRVCCIWKISSISLLPLNADKTVCLCLLFEILGKFPAGAHHCGTGLTNLCCAGFLPINRKYREEKQTHNATWLPSFTFHLQWKGHFVIKKLNIAALLCHLEPVNHSAL